MIHQSARVGILASVLFSIIVIEATCGAESRPLPEAIRIGSGKQLFLGPWAKDGRDAHLMESMKNVAMTMNEAHVTGERLVVRDKPWEGERLLDMSMFVLRDGDVFRMYYGALPKYPKLLEEPNCRILCYAESTDGVHWRKPRLGLFEWGGSRENNIIIPNDAFPYTMSEFAGPGAFIDENAKNPDERYKMILKMTPVSGQPPSTGPMLPKGQYMFTSPDGIHWKLMSSKKVNPGASDTKFSVFWDPAISKYVAYTRVKQQKEGSPKLRDLSEYSWRQYGLRIVAPRRLVGRIVSNDLAAWTEETAVLATDEMDHLGMAKHYGGDAEEGDGRLPFGRGVDIYGGNVSRYSDAPDSYIGLPNFYYHWKTADTDIGGRLVSGCAYPGTVDVQLVTSRDGIRFHRAPGRKPFIRLGPRGSWWSRMIWPSGDVIRVGDELWVYFSGHDVAHNDEQDLLVSNGAHGRAVLRLDGFISADAAYTGGEFTTRPLVFTGRRLQLNVDTSAGGVCRVEIQDQNAAPIKGFTLADADEINGNHIRVLASWNGDADVSSLAEKPVRLRFVMRDAKLFSFQFPP